LALNFLTLGAPGEASAFPGAPSSSAPGADADILAFLQAMVDASTLADAGAGAIDPPVPAQFGAPTEAAGTSPARTVVSPWNDVFIARDVALRLPLSLRHAMAASAPAVLQGQPIEPAREPLVNPLVAASTLTPVAQAGANTLAAASVEPPAALPLPTPDDVEAEAAAFLLTAAIQPQAALNPIVARTGESHSDEASADTPGSGNDDVGEPSMVAAPQPHEPVVDAPALVVVAAPMAESVPARVDHPVVEPPTGDRAGTRQQEGQRVGNSAPAAPRASAPEPSGDAAPLLVSGAIDTTPAPPRQGDAPRAQADRVRVNASGVSGGEAVDLPIESGESDVATGARSAPPPAAAAREEQRAADIDVPMTEPVADGHSPNVTAPRASVATPPAAQRAHAAWRALRQQGPGADQPLTAQAAPQLTAVPAPAATESRPVSEESHVWASAMAQAAAALTPQPPRVRTADARPLPLHQNNEVPAHVESSAAIHRLMESVLPVTAPAPHRDAHDPLLRDDRRSTAPAFGQDVAAAIALTERFEIDAPVAAKVAETPEPRALPNEAANAASIVRSMHWQYRNGVGTATVQLDPGYLGEVRVALRVDGNAVTATLHAANPEVRAWMQANEGALRQSLTAQGLSLDTLVIAEEPAMEQRTSPDGRGQSEREPERPRRPRTQTTDTEGRRFEIVV
jgi:flagellar hook-length control protein FliK